MIWLSILIFIILISIFYAWYDKTYINVTTSESDFKEAFLKESIFSKSSSQIMRDIIKASRKSKVSDWVVDYSNPMWFADIKEVKFDRSNSNWFGDIKAVKDYKKSRIPIVNKYERIIRRFIQSELRKQYLKDRIETHSLYQNPLGNTSYPSIFSTKTKSGMEMSVVVSIINDINENCIYYFIIIDSEVISYCRTEPRPHEEYQTNVTCGNLACKKFVSKVKNKLERPNMGKFRKVFSKEIEKGNRDRELQKNKAQKDVQASIDERIKNIRNKM